MSFEIATLILAGAILVTLLALEKFTKKAKPQN